MSPLRIALSGLIALLAGWGLWLALRPTAEQPRRWRRGLLFYTNQSNLLVGLYHLLLAVCPCRWLLHPGLQLSAALCIMVTFLVFHLLLAKQLEMNGLQSGLLHYAVPLLAQAYWLLFAPKAGLGFIHALWWMLIPLCYTGFICLRAVLCGPIPGSDTPWPYAFMDMQKLGFGRWLRNVLLMLAAFGLLGTVYVGLAKLMA